MCRVEVGEGGAEWKEDASEASLLNYFIARWVVHKNLTCTNTCFVVH